jgi:hypothetical protein
LIGSERSTILRSLFTVFMVGCDPEGSWEAVINSYDAASATLTGAAMAKVTVTPAASSS